MSERRWIIAVALGLAILALVGVAGKYSWDIFSAYQEDKSNERISAAEYYADTAQHSVGSCRPIVAERGIIDWLTCLADNISADGSVKQAEYDLKAQQDMAAWAFGMLIVTCWLTLITLFGVFFVWRTLKVTRDMAADAREIGEAQARAYMGIGECKMGVSLSRNGINFDLTAKNSGNSPSKECEFSACVVFFYNEPCQQSLAQETPIWVNASLAEFASSEYRREQFEFIGVMERRANTAPNPLLAQVEVVLFYRDIFCKPQSSFAEFIISYGSVGDFGAINPLTRHRVNIDGREDLRIARHIEVLKKNRKKADNR